MRKRHNLRRKPVGCALILFAKLQCIILASRPFGYPNGNLPAFAQSQRADQLWTGCPNRSPSLCCETSGVFGQPYYQTPR